MVKTDSEASDAPRAATQPPARIFPKRDSFSGSLLGIVSFLPSARFCIPSPCIRNQFSNLLTEVNQITVAPMAKPFPPRESRTTKQAQIFHIVDMRPASSFARPVSRRFDFLQTRSMLSKRDRFLMTMRTHHTESRRIEHEDQGRFSAPWASNRLRLSSGFIGFVERHIDPPCLTHEWWISFL